MSTYTVRVGTSQLGRDCQVKHLPEKPCSRQLKLHVREAQLDASPAFVSGGHSLFLLSAFAAQATPSLSVGSAAHPLKFRGMLAEAKALLGPGPCGLRCH